MKFSEIILYNSLKFNVSSAKLNTYSVPFTKENNQSLTTKDERLVPRSVENYAFLCNTLPYNSVRKQ